MPADSKDDQASQDNRIVWLINRIHIALKAKVSDLIKLCDNEDNQQTIKDFFDNNDTRCLFVLQKGVNLSLASEQTVPDDHSKKLLYFMKTTDQGKLQKVQPANMAHCIVFGDLSSNPVATLEMVSRHAFLPVVKHPGNSDLSEVVRSSFMEEVHHHLSHLLVTSGLTRGRTLLPMPPIKYPEKVSEATRDKDLLYQLESIIVAWTAQIKAAMQVTPESMLERGHPGPREEIEFWKLKRDNLLSLETQLHSTKVLKIIAILQRASSSYYKPFKELCSELRDCTEEARDNCRFLEPLGEIFQDVKDADDPDKFEQLVSNGTFKKLFHYIYIVWTRSNFYNTPPRLVVLIREICNDLIEAARTNVAVDDLFTCECTEAVQRLSSTLSVCGHFKNWYFHYKSKASKDAGSGGHGGKVRPWKFQNTTLFQRLDAFLERCHDLLDVLETVMLFTRLEKVEIGGTQGAELTANVASIHQEFNQAYEQFHSPPDAEYDILDVDEKRFDQDFANFCEKVRRMEMRLSSMLTQSMEDSRALYNTFKLVDSYEGFLDRTIIQQEWQKRQFDILRAYHDDLLMVQECFYSSKDEITSQSADPGRQAHHPLAYSPMPPTAAQLVWARGLLERVTEPFGRIQELSKPVLMSELAQETNKLHQQLVKALKSFIHVCYDKWAGEVGGTSTEKLKLPLLRRKDGQTGDVVVNFDPELVKMLREVNYLLVLNSFERQDDTAFAVPPQADTVHKMREQYRQQILRLTVVADTYNQFTREMLDVERPLLTAELAAFDDVLTRGLKRLNWHSAEIEDFIKCAMDSVMALEHIFGTFKANVSKMKELLTEFTNEEKLLPLNAKEHKTTSADDFRRKYDDHRRSREQNLRERGEQLHNLIDDSLKTINKLKIDMGGPEKALTSDSEVWVNYVAHVNEIVKDLVCQAVVHSLSNLRDQVSTEWLHKHDGIPLLDVKLILTNPDPRMAERPECRFMPHLSSKEGTGSIDTLVNEWIKDYNDMAQQVPRLDAPDDNYAQDVYAHKDANSAAKEINELISANAEQCHKFAEQFREYSHLWAKDMQKEFEEFLNPPKEVKQVAEDEEEHAVPEPQEEEDEDKPFFGMTLDKFDHEISKYEKLLEKIGDLPASATVGWLRIDAKPIRSSLQQCCKQWIDMFTGYIIQNIDSALHTLVQFMEQAEQGLEEEVPDGEDGTDALRRVLRVIRDCRKRDAATVAMFQPISEGIQMLRVHADTVDAQKLQPLEEARKEAPDKWGTLTKRVAAVRSGISDRQDREAMAIKLRALRMAEDVIGFRKDFKKLRPFYYDLELDEAYQELVQWNAKLDSWEQEACQLQDLQELFDLTPVDLPELKECRQELLYLKQLWDMVGNVRSQFSDWMTQTFKNVDAEGLIEESKKMVKQMKAMPIKCKSTGTFSGLETAVKDMMTTLPLVVELRNPAMRPRHWQQLLKKCVRDATSVDPESETFALRDLLGLHLHNYVEDVGNFVERATKELKIEKDLHKVTTYWENEARFTYEEHQGLNCYLLGPIDDIVEVLEEHLNILGTMQSNRFVDEFADQVNKWQRNLGMVESSMVKWMDLQKLWKNLYPIFIESADIREQLQEDARAFQGIDDLYRAMMSKAHMYDSVIEVCCTDTIKKQLQREDDFETLLTHIEDTLATCQKKLTEYLEGKKKLFPRFFFISDVDLIDILSKGSDPVAVLRHMSKIIDSVKTYTIKPGTKTATEIVSIQNEVVPAVQEIECEGPVEEWLGNCIDLMFKTVKAIIFEAYTTYVETNRVQWVMEKEYPGQAIVVASRIWYTQEMEQAFAQLEDGNESALKEFWKQQCNQISGLINLVLGDLKKNDRKMLVHLITIDVHARDVVTWLMDEKAESRDVFTWQSQLRYSWDDRRGSIIDICDASFVNGYEYIGLPGCLVITKLTDRCYITLSQALRLIKGGAPAGPAGTGKTETTKDLARNLGIACYVFNCSDQMDYLSLGQIFKGLSMSGSWGCFDEFNRIPIQVLSVVATQVGSILNALKTNKKRFRFMDEEISIIPSVGEWITMNPGYAGRTELPENIKSLFRPCAMCVPDLKNICEIMLAAEGFQEATDLAKKFVTLYKLNKELLSPQAHYDWGLRAVKSVLYIAGGLKRGDPTTPERGVLLRALRDTNMAKLSRDDVFVFMGLIRALFPNMDVPPKVNPELNDACVKATKSRSLLPGDNSVAKSGIFVLRCVQLSELLDVRHSVFVMGPAGCGKSECWKTLAKAFRLMGDKCDFKVMNPKAVTSDELYGYIHPQTREWKDGLLSNNFRDYAEQSQTNQSSKWLVLDGIIDAEWIESMNTVMDDNKMLTLASNERIPLTASMRMVFEISDLKNASPATVSRAGIIYINDTDLGWGPFKDKWVATREDDKEQQYLDNFFEKYVQHIFDWWKKAMHPPVAVNDLSIVCTICYLLEGLLTPENIAPGSPSDSYEKYFLFCLVWAFGGPLSSDGRIDYRERFNSWWKREPLLGQGSVRVVQDEKASIFDVFLQDKSSEIEFIPWTKIVPHYKHSFEANFSDISIETVDTTRMTFLMDKLMANRRAAVFVGTAGTGKSNLILNKLRRMDQAECIFQMIAFNAMTQPRGLQAVMEQQLEKKHGKTFGPPGKKRLVYFVDDLNMPNPDKYGTQEAIEFIRLHIDYQFWYDRIKPGFPLKEIASCQYLSAMNPKSGTFTVMDRLLRHFAFFACSMPDQSDLLLIYGSIMKGHWGKWSKGARTLAEVITQATINLHRAIATKFLPTAIKFHYQWNMREMYNIFQGLCNSVQKEHDRETELVRLWCHECNRTFRDRMCTEEDQRTYDQLLENCVADKMFQELSPSIKRDDILLSPGEQEMGQLGGIWAPFGIDKDGNEGVLKDMESWGDLNKFLNDKLTEYNDCNAMMPLVLFENAMEHVCRICRVVSNPRGNAMLVGVGGSGKQSLSRLASFICGLDKFQIVVTAKYSIADFRVDVSELYKKCGQKNMQFAFLITDGQIVVREMLVYLNDLLNSGNIPDLFPPDEMDSIQGGMVNEAKAAGVLDLTPAVLWQFFINKVRCNLHTILCFSPVGKQFSTWCRQFPALANTTVIDWFHPWPEQALVSVAERFLDGVDLGDHLPAIAQHMAFCHQHITTSASDYLNEEKRFCYTTPKSFLELISLYKVLLQKKRATVEDNRERLSNGIDKIQMAKEQVDDLQVKLLKEQEVVAQKAEVTGQMMETVSKEKAVVAAEQEKASVEEQKTNKVFMESEAMAADCARDLAAAQPIVEEALAALNSLRKEDLTELKALAKPPSDVEMVAAAVMVLTADPKKVPPVKARDWANSKKMMANVGGWMKELIAFDYNNIPQSCIDAIQVYLKDPAFVPAAIKTKSQAAAGLCAWVVNMGKYHVIRCEVKPKEEKLLEAQDRLQRSKAELKKVQDRVSDLNAKCQNLIREFEKASEELREIEAKAKKTQEKAELADRLVNGLSGEKVRWAATIEDLIKQRTLLIGDVLMSAAFVSYIGPFSKNFRDRIMQVLSDDVKDHAIPHTEGLDIVLGCLTSDAEVASWQNEELKSDRLSTENGALVVNCTRWPLLIDPQMQGVKWIRTREEKRGLNVCQASQKKYLDTVIKCLEEGLPCMIENLGDTIDPILEPVLGRAVIRKGSQKLIKLGDKEVGYDDNFSLFLQTRLNNPHYKPEINAQTTLINFMVTQEGLEDQLLSVVVNKERPDLEQQRVTLLRRMNQMTIDLENCEEGLLAALAAATGDILENVALVEQLESTKKKAAEINKSMALAKQTQADIANSRKTYTDVAIRGSLLFFQIDQLAKIQHMYQYSLSSYMVIFIKALNRAEQPEDRKDLQARCDNLTRSITENIFAFVSRGLFESHKLIFSALLCFAILRKEDKIAANHLQYLLRGPKKQGTPRPESIESWLPDSAWQSVQALKEVDGTQPRFEQLESDIVESGRWKVWCELERPEHPEEGRLPTDWKALSDFQRLLVLRALRADRLTVGLTHYVSSAMGQFYVEDKAVPVGVSFEDSGPKTPMFFILSPGVDPVQLVVELGKKLGFTEDADKFFNVSLGQGQEPRAFNALETCFKNGGWAMLNNIHLVEAFCKQLDKRLDYFDEVYTKLEMWEKRRKEKRMARRGVKTADAIPAEDGDGEGAEGEGGAGEGEEAPEGGDDGGGDGAADAAEGEEGGGEDGEGEGEGLDDPDAVEEDEEDDEDDPELKWEGEKGDTDFRVFLSAEPGLTIPIGILQRSIKLTNEPPSGIRANMMRAFANFVHEPWENSQKPTEFKAVVFAMCYFHSIVIERKKFGPIGWNRGYPFNAGDLTTCIEVFYNYEERPKIPWDDLRYIYGEIMYGGHITDDWDRVLCMAYLSNFLQSGLTDELELAPGLIVPAFESYAQGKECMLQVPPETPLLYGLHPNAEIGFQTASANKLFATINELQPKGAGAAGANPDEEVREKLQKIMDELPDAHNLQDISERLDEDRAPQAHVFYQECERTNALRGQMAATLGELDLGLKGALSMSEAMMELYDCMLQDRMPPVWAKVSFMSMRPLGAWFENMKERNSQLAEWTGELATPKVVCINHFFNPMSFLTAIMQDTAIKNSFDLDQMALVSDVLKKMPDAIEYGAKDGAHIFGMYMEGARWDTQQGSIEDSHMKDLYPRVPVVTIRSLPVAKIERKDQYECPLYKTQGRGPGIVTGLWLKTKQPARKWVIAGVCLLLDVVE